MANVYQNMTMIATKSVIQVENNMVLAKRFRREYDDEFGKGGKKIGSQFRIRKTPRFITTDVVNITDFVANGPGYKDPDYVTLNLNQNIIGALGMLDNEILLDFDMEKDRVIDPYAIQMANDYDRKCAAQYANVGNFVGTPGTAITGTEALKKFKQAAALLNKNGAPKRGRYAIYDADVDVEIAMSHRTSETGGVPESAIARSLQAAYSANPLNFWGLKWDLDQNLYAHEVGTVTGLVNATLKTTLVETGISGITGTIILQGFTPGATLKAGDKISFGTLNSTTARLAVNPLNRQSTGYLQKFSVVGGTYTASGAGEMTIQVSPAIQGPTLTGGVSNPLQNISGFPVAGDAVSVWGVTAAATVAGKSSNVSLVFQEEAFALACVPLPKFNGLHMAGRATDDQTGMSIRVGQQYNILTTQLVTRMDSLCGLITVEPAWAVNVMTT